jgi:hypothetical protein
VCEFLRSNVCVCVFLTCTSGSGFPHAENELDIQVQTFLGATNKRLLQQSKEAFISGDIPRIGSMTPRILNIVL